MQRHRHQEFIRFLNVVEAAVPAGKVVHAILDNYAVQSHAKVRQWLERHPRWVFHFTPTSSSRFVAEHNQTPKPITWRADPNAIIAARKRGFQTLESIH